MGDSWLERAAPLTGVVYFVLLVAGTLVINNYEWLPPSDEIKSFYEDNSTAVRIGGYLVLLSVAFFLWFLGSVRARLRVAEGAAGRLSAVAFGGGVAVGVTMIVGMGATVAGAARASADGGIGVDTATGLFDLAAVLMGTALPIGFAVLLGATAVVSFRTGVFARWLTWATAVVAVGLLIPEINFAITGLAAIWVVVVSILLYTSGRSTPPQEPA